jgi:hypothetical protein
MIMGLMSPSAASVATTTSRSDELPAAAAEP